MSYLDPGAGSIARQEAVATAGSFAVKRCWMIATNGLRRGISRPRSQR